jgi:hypothetical protein
MVAFTPEGLEFLHKEREGSMQSERGVGKVMEIAGANATTIEQMLADLTKGGKKLDPADKPQSFRQHFGLDHKEE